MVGNRCAHGYRENLHLRDFGCHGNWTTVITWTFVNKTIKSDVNNETMALVMAAIKMGFATLIIL